MQFSTVKKGYAPKEVDEYIAAVKREYEKTIVKQRDRIQEMLSKQQETEHELASYRAKSNQISKAIVSAVQKAEEIERLSRLKYDQEIERLKAFHEKWTQYYDKILEAYPLDARLAAAGDFNRRMDKILARVGKEDIAAALAETTNAAPPNARPFDPMERIDDYFAAERKKEKADATPVAAAKAQDMPRDYADRSPSGFSFEEALNPTQDLEDILKDLGL